jgi:hypothetical protein
LRIGYDSFLGDLTMKKLFASMIVLGALVAMGCGEKDTTPADDAAPPVEEPADETPMEEPAAP